MLIRVFLAVAALACSPLAAAQGYPSRPITFMVPAPPGGALDGTARVLAEEMSKSTGQPVVVDNRPGALGVLAVQGVTRAPADGYTVLVTHTAPLLNTPHMLKKAPYDVRRDLAFVSVISRGPVAVVINPKIPATNMKEFLAWAAQNKGKVSYGSYGVGTFPHLVGFYLSRSKGLDMVHVPYKGEAPAMQDVMAGNLDWSVVSLSTARSQVESGKLRALAVFGEQRAKVKPDLPTMAESGLPDKEYTPGGWLSVLVRAGTPPEIINSLAKAVHAAAFSPAMGKRFQVSGTEPVGSTPEEFRLEFEESEPIVRRLLEMSGAKASVD